MRSERAQLEPDATSRDVVGEHFAADNVRNRDNCRYGRRRSGAAAAAASTGVYDLIRTMFTGCAFGHIVRELREKFCKIPAGGPRSSTVAAAWTILWTGSKVKSYLAFQSSDPSSLTLEGGSWEVMAPVGLMLRRKPLLNCSVTTIISPQLKA